MFSVAETPPKEMTMNIQFLVRFDTCLKLNLLDENGAMISKDDEMDKESHYVLFETVTDRYTVSYKVVGQLMRRFFDKSLKFEEFKIVDFDNCLNGNKPIQEDE